MRLIINGLPYEPHDPLPASKVDVWFDGSRGVRSWVVQKLDAEGNQVGEAFHYHRKEQALELQRILRREIARELGSVA